MTEIEQQIAKMEKFAKDNNFKIHPKRVVRGGIPYMAKMFLANHHCPCVAARKECPCKESLEEINKQGFCECRLFTTDGFQGHV